MGGAALDEADAVLPPPPTNGYNFRDARRCKTTVALGKQNVCTVAMEAKVDAPANALFKLLADPNKHSDIFEAIESADSTLLSDNGTVKKYRLDYRAKWRFWKVHGVCDNRLFMWVDSASKTVTFKLREPGFLKVYEGKWQIQDASPTSISTPVPPPMQARALCSISSGGISGVGSRSSTPGVTSANGAPLFVKGGLNFSNFSHLSNLGGVSGLLARLSNPFGNMQSAMRSAAASSGVVAVAPPRGGSSIIRVDNTMSPQISPPYPLSLTLKGHGVNQVQEMVQGLLDAATRLEDEEGVVESQKSSRGSKLQQKRR